MFNYKILIEYDGTDYVGWQSQNNGRSIQNSIEISIEKLISEKVKIFGAGRTDAGVHAKGQVANFFTSKEISLDTIRDGLNQHLRSDSISILSAENVNKNFNARFSAKKRWYEYRVINRRPPLTLENKRAWCVHKQLNIDKIINESKFFLGKYDFDSFRSVDCQSATSIKTIDFFKITTNGENIIFTISAKSFLHSQVRIMVGTLIDIGKGLLKKSILEIINSKKREYAGMTAPAYGLYLKKIDY